MRRRALRVALGGVLALGAGGLAPAAAAAQPLDCEWLQGTNSVTGREAVGGTRIVYVSRPRIRCTDGRYMEADSLVSYEAAGLHQLIGRVYFQDPSQSLRAATARYYDALSRLEADGDVELTDRESGNTLRGQRLLYLRENDRRLRREITVTGVRPTATLYPESSPGGPPAAAGEVVPYEVEADRHFLLGDELFRATGRVVLDRDSLHAVADSMDYDRLTGQLYLNQRARLTRRGMDLSARHLHLMLPGSELTEVAARDSARLVGEQIEVDAPTIRVFFTAGEVERLVAVAPAVADSAPRAGAAPTEAAPPPPAAGGEGEEPAPAPRAVARAQSLTMTADSLEVVAPAERIERLVASGGARAVSTARDSLNTPDTPEIARTDWIEGDTVIASFRPDTAGTAAPDQPPERYVLERLEAVANARSLYRMEPDTTAAGEVVPDSAAVTGAGTAGAAGADTAAAAGGSPTPSAPLHYVEADRIVIVFANGEVEHMEVAGLRRGLYLTPRAGGRGARARERHP